MYFACEEERTSTGSDIKRFLAKIVLHRFDVVAENLPWERTEGTFVL